MGSKANRLFIILSGIFITNALIAEFVGVKIFSLEASLGWERFSFNFFGKSTSLDLTAGVLLWPVVFILTDVINEYFGKKGVQFLSNLTVGLIAFAFLMVFTAMNMSPANWWIGVNIDKGVPNMSDAFNAVFGQGLWIIIASLVAFLIGQIVDVYVFQRIKRVTGEKSVWLRATGSTLVSQLIDSFVVLFIAFYIGANWSFQQVLAIALTNYVYKFTVAIGLTPALYGMHYIIDRYLGEAVAQKLKQDALLNT